MNKLQDKLRDNKNRVQREKFLSELEPKFSALLASAEFSNDIACMKYAAFPKWDAHANMLTTSRGDIKNWNNFTFKTWPELITALAMFQKVKNYIGWFFENRDGQYYKISINAFLSNIQSISDYGTAHGHYDFGWVGADDDVGIIIERSLTPSGGNEFRISVWGI